MAGLLCVGIVAAYAWVATAAAQSESRTIYVTALDRNGALVTDLQAG